MPTSTNQADYRLGALYSLTTATLLAMQSPFSALAAKTLSSPLFVCFTQIALLLSVPMLVLPKEGWRQLSPLLLDIGNVIRLAVLFMIGTVGLLLYNWGLSDANPMITAAIMNLSPFWAALVAFLISKKAIPGSPPVFVGCFIVAFIGAMIVAWSQLDKPDWGLASGGLVGALRSRWIYAVPTPIFFALSGALVFKWFGKFREPVVIGANFVISAAILIPVTLIMAHSGGRPGMNDASVLPILLLVVGTLCSSAVGRVFYQVALTAADNDNGFVTMFFLLVPVIASLISIPLSLWIPELRVVVGPPFLLGLALVTAPLAVFSVTSWRGAPAQSEGSRASAVP